MSERSFLARFWKQSARDETVPNVPESSERVPDAERVADAVFWTFHIAQGKSHIQKKAMETMLAGQPTLVEAVFRYWDSIPKVGPESERNPIEEDATFKNTLEKVQRYVNARSHTSDADFDRAQSSVRGEYQNLFKSAIQQKSQPSTLDQKLSEFLPTFIHRDLECAQEAAIATITEEDPNNNEANSKRNARWKARYKQGASFLMMYCFSEDHERLQAAMPPDMRFLWSAMASYVRKNGSKTFDKDTKHKLRDLKAIYQRATGKKITLRV